jgi:hypothetical protein
VAFDAGAIEATLDLDRSPFTRGLREARREGEAFERRRFTATLDIDINRAGLNRALGALGSTRAGAVRVPVQVDDQSVQRSLNNISSSTHRTATRVGNRLARALLSPVGIQLATFPALMAAGVAAAGVTLAGLPLLFGAVAGAVLSQNEEVAGSFKNLWDTVRNDAEEIVEPLIPWAHGVADELDKSWARLTPTFERIAGDIGPQVLDLTQGVTGMFENMMEGVADAIQVGGPAVRGFESLLRKVGLGAGAFFRNVSEESIATGEGLRTLGDIIEDSLGFAGSFIAQLAAQWATSGPQVANTIDQLLDSVLSFTEGALPAFGDGLSIILSVLQAVMTVLSPITSLLGGFTGYVIAAAAAAKLAGGAFGLMQKGVNNLKPGTWTTRMQGLGQAISNVGDRAGAAAGGLHGGAQASERWASAGQRLGRAVQNLGAAIPFVGVALVAIGIQQENAAEAANKLAEGLLRGGEAARQANATLAATDDLHKRLAESIPLAGKGIADSIFGTADAARTAYRDQVNSLTDVEKAQIRAKQAQVEYEEAVDKFGPTSKEAASASDTLSVATDNVETAQRDAANATKSLTDRIIEQTNLMLGSIGARLNYQSSLLQLEEAQRNVNTVTAEHGAESLEARQANLQYQQSIMDVVNAIGQRVTKENASLGETEAARLATLAMHQEIARLAVEAGTNLPPALAEMAAALTDSELAALGVTREVDEAGNAIYRLPPGKSIAFPTDAPVAKSQIEALGRAVDNVKSTKWVNFYLNYVVMGKPPSGFDPGPGSGLLLGSSSGNVQGGYVRKGFATWVGEGGRELFYPATDGMIVPHAKSEMIESQGVGKSGPPVQATGSDGADLLGVLEYIAVLLENQRLSVRSDELTLMVNQRNVRNEGR